MQVRQVSAADAADAASAAAAQHRRAHHVTASHREPSPSRSPSESFFRHSASTVSVTHDRHHDGALRDQESEPAGSPFAKRLSTRTTLSKKKHEEQPWRTKRTSPTYARRGRRSWASWDVPRPLYLRVSCHRCAHRAGFGVTGHGNAFPSNDGRSGPVLSTDSSRRKCTDSYVETSFGKQTVSCGGVSVEEH